MARDQEGIMEKLIHHASTAPATSKWYPTDTEELYLRNLKIPEKRQQLETFGWIDTDIEYVNNSHGFRTDEFLTKDNFVTVGCSLTYGIGLPQKYTWASLLSEQLDLPVYNLGIPGSSGDTCYRVIKHYVPLLKPKFVVVCEPDISRLEIFISQQPYIHLLNMPDLHGFAKDQWFKFWYTSSNNSQIHAQKNLEAMAYVCQMAGSEFYYYTNNFYLKLYSQVGGFARDLQHPGIQFNRLFSDTVYNDIVNKCTYEQKS